MKSPGEDRPEAIAPREQMTKLLDFMDDERIAPREGLSISTQEFRSSPDGNTIKVQLIRPEAREPLAGTRSRGPGSRRKTTCEGWCRRSSA